MTTTWSITAGEIIKQAMVELGAISSGEAPDSTETEDALLRLNAMLNTWAGENNLFREGSGTLSVTGGTATLPSDVMTVNSVSHIVSSTYHRPLVEWNRSQYYILPNRNAVGNPTIYYIRKTVSGNEIHLWPIPSGTVTLAIDYGRAPNTADDIDETVDIPQDWQEAVIMGLASRCASMFGTTRLDPGTVQRVDGRAAELYQKLLDRDRPDSYYFEPWDGCYC